MAKKSTSKAPQNVTTDGITQAKTDYLTNYASENNFNILRKQQMQEDINFLQQNPMMRQGGQPCYGCGGNIHYNNGGAYMDAYNRTNNPNDAFSFIGQMGRNAQTWLNNEEDWVTKLKPSRQFKKQQKMNNFYADPANYQYFEPGGSTISQRLLQGSNLTQPVPGAPSSASAPTQSTLDRINQDFRQGSDWWQGNQGQTSQGYNPYLDEDIYRGMMNSPYYGRTQGWGRGDYVDRDYRQNTGISYPGYPPMMPQRRGYGRGWSPSYGPPGMVQYDPTKTYVSSYKQGPRRSKMKFKQLGSAPTTGERLQKGVQDAFTNVKEGVQDLNEKNAVSGSSQSTPATYKQTLEAGSLPTYDNEQSYAPEGYIQREIDPSVPANAYPQTSSADFGSGIGGVEQEAPALTKAEQRTQKKADKAKARLEKKKMKNAFVSGNTAMVGKRFTPDMMNQMGTTDNGVYTYNGELINPNVSNPSNTVIPNVPMNSEMDWKNQFNMGDLPTPPPAAPNIPTGDPTNPSRVDLRYDAEAAANAMNPYQPMGYGGVPFHEGYPQAQPFPTPWPQAMMKQGGGLWGNQQPMIYPGGMQRPAGVMPNVLGSAYYQGGGPNDPPYNQALWKYMDYINRHQDPNNPVITDSTFQHYGGFGNNQVVSSSLKEEDLGSGWSMITPTGQDKNDLARILGNYVNQVGPQAGVQDYVPREQDGGEWDGTGFAPTLKPPLFERKPLEPIPPGTPNTGNDFQGSQIWKNLANTLTGQEAVETALSGANFAASLGEQHKGRDNLQKFKDLGIGDAQFTPQSMEDASQGTWTVNRGEMRPDDQVAIQFGEGPGGFIGSPMVSRYGGQHYQGGGPSGVGTMDEIMMMPDNAVGPGGYGTMGEFKQSSPQEQEQWMQWALTQSGATNNTSNPNYDLVSPTNNYQPAAESTSVATNTIQRMGGQQYEVGGTYEMSDKELEEFYKSGGRVRYF